MFNLAKFQSTTEVSAETNPGQPDDIIVLKNGHAVKLDTNQTSEIGALLKLVVITIHDEISVYSKRLVPLISVFYIRLPLIIE